MFLKIKCSLPSIYLISVCLNYPVVCRYLEDFNKNSSNSAEEIQHAICKVATEDIQATANATITRQLKGVCTSKEITKHFEELEDRILSEIALIKDSLNLNLNNIQQKPMPIVKHDPDYHKDRTKNTQYQYNTKQATNKNSNPDASSTKSLNDNYDNNRVDFQLPSLDTIPKRDFEATKNNGTIQFTELGKSYLYYWKIYDIEDVLESSNLYITSPTFYVSGSPLQIKLHPRHLATRYLALELSKVGYFAAKHRFVILNQVDLKGDIGSQILGVDASLFRVSMQKRINSDFTVDGSLTVKVIIAIRN